MKKKMIYEAPAVSEYALSLEETLCQASQLNGSLENMDPEDYNWED